MQMHGTERLPTRHTWMLGQKILSIVLCVQGLGMVLTQPLPSNSHNETRHNETPTDHTLLLNSHIFLGTRLPEQTPKWLKVMLALHISVLRGIIQPACQAMSKAFLNVDTDVILFYLSTFFVDEAVDLVHTSCWPSAIALSARWVREPSMLHEWENESYQLCA